MMEKYNTAKSITNQKLKALEADILSLRQTSQVSAQRYSILLKRQHDLTVQHGGSKVLPSDIIKLNIGGSKMFVLRETLTLIKGSRLEVLFSGRWESKLLRDNEGFVFMDLDARYFKRIMEYLYLMKMQKAKNEGKPPALPKMMNGDEQKVLDLYIDFFNLRVSKGEGSRNVINMSVISNDSLLDAFKKEQQELTLVKKNLDEMEEKLGVEEDFVSFFTDAHSKHACAVPRDANDDISFTSMTSDLDSDVSSIPSNQNDNNDSNTDTIKGNTILKLWIDGEIIPVKRSTMCICKGSHLADNFNDDKWMKKHSFKCDDGTEVILIEHSALIFKTIINQLRLRAMMASGDGEEMPLVKMSNDKDMVLLENLESNLFASKEECILGKDKASSMDSVILTSESENYHIKTWLGEVDKISEPELLYRGSRDGWNCSDFHQKCNEKGATLTIVKTSDGYVFGGYSDQSLSSVNFFDHHGSSNESFLFSLKCHGGLAPTKMKIKSGKNQDAVCTSSSHGLTFGRDHDLHIGCNGTMKGGFIVLNHTYEIPVGASKAFLTGKYYGGGFQLVEVEVFKV